MRTGGQWVRRTEGVGGAFNGTDSVGAADAFFEGGCLRVRGRGAGRRGRWLGVWLV